MKRILIPIALFLAFTNYGYAQGTKKYSTTSTSYQNRNERGEYENVIQVTDNILIRHIKIRGRWVWQINKLSRSVVTKEKEQLTKPFIGDNRWTILTNKDFPNLFSLNGSYVLQEILKVIIRNDPKKIVSLATHVVQQGHFGYLPYYSEKDDPFRLQKSAFFLYGGLKTKYNNVIRLFSEYVTSFVDGDLKDVEVEGKLQAYYAEKDSYINIVQEYLRDLFLDHLGEDFEKSVKFDQTWPILERGNFIFTFFRKSNDNTPIGRRNNPALSLQPHLNCSNTIRIVISIKKGEIILNSIYPS